MLTAVIYERSDSTFEVHVTAEDGDEGETTGEEIDEALEADEGPSPIAPEMKELLWGFGAFLVFLLAMRLFLVPKVKRGMDARYGKIRGQHEQADEATAAAEREVADYQEALAGVRAEAVTRIDAARHTLDAERADKLAEVNARIAERRARRRGAGRRGQGGAAGGDRGGRRRRRRPSHRAGHRPPP